MFFPPLTLLSIVGLAFATPLPASNTSGIALVKKQQNLNSFLAILLEVLPEFLPSGGNISTITNELTTFESLLAVLTGVQTTYNQLGGPCTEYTVIFARGTSEPGNVGVLVGPPFFDALESLVGTSALTIQGVNDYAASITGYLEGGDATGSAEMATEIEQAYEDCPNTKLIVSGYSQGCQLVHNAAAQLPAAVAEWISSVILFGDPDDGQAMPNIPASKVDTFCNVGDDICQDGIFITEAHLIYSENATAAAEFAVAAAA